MIDTSVCMDLSHNSRSVFGRYYCVALKGNKGTQWKLVVESFLLMCWLYWLEYCSNRSIHSFRDNCCRNQKIILQIIDSILLRRIVILCHEWEASTGMDLLIVLSLFKQLNCVIKLFLMDLIITLTKQHYKYILSFMRQRGGRFENECKWPTMLQRRQLLKECLRFRFVWYLNPSYRHW
jgi:hypothetical protein